MAWWLLTLARQAVQALSRIPTLKFKRRSVEAHRAWQRLSLRRLSRLRRQTQRCKMKKLQQTTLRRKRRLRQADNAEEAEAGQAAEDESHQAGGQEEEQEGEDEGPLPPGWTKIWSDEHENYYFWHKVTKTTTWERPAPEPEEKAEGKGVVIKGNFKGQAPKGKVIAGLMNTLKGGNEAGKGKPTSAIDAFKQATDALKRKSPADSGNGNKPDTHMAMQKGKKGKGYGGKSYGAHW